MFPEPSIPTKPEMKVESLAERNWANPEPVSVQAETFCVSPLHLLSTYPSSAAERTAYAKEPASAEAEEANVAGTAGGDAIVTTIPDGNRSKVEG